MPVFQCLKPSCGFNTSGIVRDVSSDRRWCPRCESPLLICNHCSCLCSGTEQDGAVVCDKCGADVSLEALTIAIREKALREINQKPTVFLQDDCKFKIETDEKGITIVWAK